MTASRVPVFRFAPSPNGYLHLGHAYSALLNDALAKRLDGQLLLRLEDIDLERCKPDFEKAIFNDLEWLGIEWEVDVMRQSSRFSVYQTALDALRERGLIYPAFWSRGEIRKFVSTQNDWPRDPDGVPHYPGPERTWSDVQLNETIAEGRAFSWRLNMTKALSEIDVPDALEWGDVVLARTDTPTSYHLAVVIDDAVQGVTDVIRGQDLAASTSVHHLLQGLLGLPVPRYFHHRLILDGVGKKLSKSGQSTAISDLRTKGMTSDDVRRMVGWDDGEVDQIINQLV